MPNLIKDNIQKTSNNSSRTIKKLLKQRSLVVAFSLLLTGLGASITSISFKTGIYFINNWRLALLDQFPSIAVLPIFGALGGAIAGYLIKNIAPAAISGTKDEIETKEKVVINADGVVIAEDVKQINWTTGKEDGTFPTDSTWEASKTVPVYQAIDQSKLVPLMVKTIQELEARIKTLEDA